MRDAPGLSVRCVGPSLSLTFQRPNKYGSTPIEPLGRQKHRHLAIALAIHAVVNDFLDSNTSPWNIGEIDDVERRSLQAIILYWVDVFVLGNWLGWGSPCTRRPRDMRSKIGGGHAPLTDEQTWPRASTEHISSNTTCPENSLFVKMDFVFIIHRALLIQQAGLLSLHVWYLSNTG